MQKHRVSRRFLAECFLALARIAVGEKSASKAAWLLGAAERARSESSMRRDQTEEDKFDGIKIASQNLLSIDEWETLFHDGMSIENLEALVEGLLKEQVKSLADFRQSLLAASTLPSN
jgi:predicted metal-dependent hydrolase